MYQKCKSYQIYKYYNKINICWLLGYIINIMYLWNYINNISYYYIYSNYYYKLSNIIYINRNLMVDRIGSSN